eukprot:m.1048200 g.1048200  ORF g.1048200 m.1048200 type:complete len:608 (+) comp24172_c0_seq30:304-2127(+)
MTSLEAFYSPQKPDPAADHKSGQGVPQAMSTPAVSGGNMYNRSARTVSADTVAQLRSILPNLGEDDAENLLLSHGDGVADAADAYFLSQASAAKGALTPPRGSDGQTSPLPVSPQSPTMAFHALSLPTCDESAIAPQLSSPVSSLNTSLTDPASPARADTPTNADALLVTRRTSAMRYFGISIVDLMSLPENREQSLPRIVVYLCEYLLARASRKSEALYDMPQRRRDRDSIAEDLREMIEGDMDLSVFNAAKQQFNTGVFSDCGSGTCMFRLLKAFVRELPAPLIPRTYYDQAMAIAGSHMNQTVQQIRHNANYALLLEGFNLSAEHVATLNTWLMEYWTGCHDGSPPRPEFAAQCAKLVGVVESAAFSVRHSMSDLAEFFFALPKTNRIVLEYICVCFAKMDLMDRRGGKPSGGSTTAIPTVLRMLAETFASHVLRPQTWSTGDVQDRHQRQRLQEAFLLAVLYFVKRKHNLLTALERKCMESASEEAPAEALDEILFDAVSAAAKLSQAFENAMAVPTVSTTAGIHCMRIASVLHVRVTARVAWCGSSECQTVSAMDSTMAMHWGLSCCRPLKLSCRPCQHGCHCTRQWGWQHYICRSRPFFGA